MPRYIDADAFDADCRKRYCTDCNNYNGVKCRACWVDDMLGDVEDAPTVSPDEVRGVGTWLRKEKVRHNLDGDGDYRYECSACGHSDEHNENVHVPFCWYCGAKMEVEGDA